VRELARLLGLPRPRVPPVVALRGWQSQPAPLRHSQRLRLAHRLQQARYPRELTQLAPLARGLALPLEQLPEWAGPLTRGLVRPASQLASPLSWLAWRG